MGGKHYQGDEYERQKNQQVLEVYIEIPSEHPDRLGSEADGK
jgi:hypothetical protein